MMWPWPDDASFSRGDGGRGRPQSADERLAREVADTLLADDRTRQQHIVVDVQDRVVLLTGVVDTRPTRETVSSLTRTVPGVRDVCNGLRVRVSDVPPDVVPSDSALTDGTAFDDIVARLQTEPAAPDPARPAPGRAGVPPLLLTALVGVLVVALTVAAGSIGLLIACGLAALAVDRLLHRRS